MRFPLIFILICLSFASQAQTSLIIYNYSQWDIYHIYVSPDGSDSWSSDLLALGESNTNEVFLSPDKNIDFDLSSEGDWKVKVIDEDGDECIIPHSYFTSQYVLEIYDDILIECFYSQ